MPPLAAPAESWDARLVYVIGHQRPDTDAIASAIGYAWLLSLTGEASAVAARCGQPTLQAAFALQRFEQPAPRLLRDAAPTFGHAAHAEVPVRLEDPLSAAVAQFAAGERVVPVVDDEGRAMGAVTAMALARALTTPRGGGVFLSQPCREHLEELDRFAAHERISDHRRALLRNDADDFLVIDRSGRYSGLATRGRLLEPPRARLVLVDHNELTQAVAGADQADIIAVLDHHRLGNPPTAAPIPFTVDPVGSTSTLVAERCRACNLNPPAGISGMLLSGILSDTLLFRSPTTTDRDRNTAGWLASLLGVDAAEYGRELMEAGPGLNDRPASEILESDRKSYDMGGVAVTVAQVEVAGFAELPEQRDSLLRGLETLRERENLALAGLLVTDVLTARSRLLCCGEPRLITALPFNRIDEGEYDLGDIVSRKKQLVPILHDTLQGA